MSIHVPNRTGGGRTIEGIINDSYRSNGEILPQLSNQHRNSINNHKVSLNQWANATVSGPSLMLGSEKEIPVLQKHANLSGGVPEVLYSNSTAKKRQNRMQTLIERLALMEEL